MTPTTPIPAPAPPPAAADVDDAEVAALWQQFVAGRAGERDSRAHLAEVARRLGLLLDLHRRTCIPGGFVPWLRYHHIPLSTAYQLMKKHAAAPPQPLETPLASNASMAPPAPVAPPPFLTDQPYGWQGADFYLRLNPLQTTAVDRALQALAAAADPSFELVGWFAHAIADGVPAESRQNLLGLWSRPLQDFP